MITLAALAATVLIHANPSEAAWRLDTSLAAVSRELRFFEVSQQQQSPKFEDETVEITPGTTKVVEAQFDHPDVTFVDGDKVLFDAGTNYLSVEEIRVLGPHVIAVRVRVDGARTSLGRVGFTVKDNGETRSKATGTLILRASRPVVESVTVTQNGGAPLGNTLSIRALQATRATIELRGTGFYDAPKIEFEDKDRFTVEGIVVHPDRLLLEVRTAATTPPLAGWQALSISSDFAPQLYQERAIFVRGLRPTVMSLEPAEVPADASYQVVKIKGSHFGRQVQVQLGDQLLDPSEIVTASENEIAFSVRTPSTSANSRLEVRVVNPDGQVSPPRDLEAKSAISSITVAPTVEDGKLVYGRPISVHLKTAGTGTREFRDFPYTVSLGGVIVPRSAVQFVDRSTLLLSNVQLADPDPEGPASDPLTARVEGHKDIWTGPVSIRRPAQVTLPPSPVKIHRGDSLLLELPGKRLDGTTVVSDGQIVAEVASTTSDRLVLRIATKPNDRLGVHRLQLLQHGGSVASVPVEVERWRTFDYVQWNPGSRSFFAWTDRWPRVPHVSREGTLHLRFLGTRLPNEARPQRVRVLARTRESRTILLDSALVIERQDVELPVRVPSDIGFGQRIEVLLMSPGDPPSIQEAQVVRSLPERFVLSTGLSALVFPTDGSDYGDNVDVLNAASVGLDIVIADRGAFRNVRPNVSLIGLGPEKDAPAALGVGGFLVLGGRLMLGGALRVTGDDRYETAETDGSNTIWKRSNVYLLIGGKSDLIPWK